MEREPWPGENDDAPTEVKLPPPEPKEQTRAETIRQETRAARDPGQIGTMLVYAVLEVSAAVDRLTAELRYRNSRARP